MDCVAPIALRRRMIPVFMSAGLMGCEYQLMPTPNIYATGDYDLVEAGDGAALPSSTIELLYVTDRKRLDTPDGSVKYGWKRSRSVAWGTCEVEIGDGLDWSTLAENTTRRKRDVELPEHVRLVTEFGRFTTI